MLASESAETGLVRHTSFIARTVIVLNWIAILTIMAIARVPKNVALGAFTIFRITAVLALLWLIAEAAEGFAGRTTFVNVVIDMLLILPMFVLWFLVAVTTF